MPTALITGASYGIGTCFAQRLAAEGYDLVLVARSEERLVALARELRHTQGSLVEVLAVDLTNAAARRQVEQRLCDSVDLLVNNAGIGVSAAFPESSGAELQRQLDLNVTALQALTRAAIPAMQQRGRGQVVNVSSVAGLLPGYGCTYAASKAWVTAFSEGLDRTLRGTGVRVLALCPGFTRTADNQHDFDELAPWLPRGLVLRPERVVGDCLADVRRGRVRSVPGVADKTVVGLAGVLPRRVLRSIASRLDFPVS